MSSREAFDNMQQALKEEYGELLYRSLLKSLNNTLGSKNAEIVVSMLREKGAVKNNALDIRRLDEALQSIFGEAGYTVLHRNTSRP